jgi:hypothetical protein
VEACKDLILRLALHIEAEHILRLDGFKILATLFEFEAVIREELFEIRIGGGYIGVHFQAICPALLGKGFAPVQQVVEGVLIVQIADGTTAGVHQTLAKGRHFADEHAHSALDFAILPAGKKAFPLPHRLLLAPEIALGKVALGMGLEEAFKLL